MKASTKKVVLIGVIVLLFLVGSVITLSMANGGSEITKQLNLGEKYLSELDYENAILTFENVLKIEPRNVSAYVGLADASNGKSDTPAAIEWLQKGYDLTGDKKLAQILEELHGGAQVNETPEQAHSNLLPETLYDVFTDNRVEEAPNSQPQNHILPFEPFYGTRTTRRSITPEKVSMRIKQMAGKWEESKVGSILEITDDGVIIDGDLIVEMDFIDGGTFEAILPSGPAEHLFHFDMPNDDILEISADGEHWIFYRVKVDNSINNLYGQWRNLEAGFVLEFTENGEMLGVGAETTYEVVGISTIRATDSRGDVREWHFTISVDQSVLTLTHNHLNTTTYSRIQDTEDSSKRDRIYGTWRFPSSDAGGDIIIQIVREGDYDGKFLVGETSTDFEFLDDNVICHVLSGGRKSSLMLLTYSINEDALELYTPSAHFNQNVTYYRETND